MAVTRRDLLKAGAASGALLLARPKGAFADLLTGTGRQSKLFPGSGLRLVHADLHNHSVLSDGNGRAEDAFASMRAAGLDIAALTDHAGVGKGQGSSCQGCAQAVGIDEGEWARIGTIADAANRDESFVAVRGFEWSSPTLGHMNVWFSETWTDPLATGAIGGGTTAAYLLHAGNPPFPAEVETQVNDVLRAVPEGQASMTGLYDWLKADPGRTGIGGGNDGVAGFNHPGREGGRFGFFAYDAQLRHRVVSIEMFNRGEDYLYEQVDGGAASPLVECLDAGWNVGILGVTDEHGTNWGFPQDKGRTGLWVRSLTREGVKEALVRRRFFATRERGLRLDASAEGQPMGSYLAHDAGQLAFALDVDRGPEWWGRPLRVQVLQSGRPLPTVVHQVDVTVPRDDEPPIAFTAPVSRDAGDWVVLRVTDPARPADGRAAPYAAYRDAGRGVAYSSPFFLAPAPDPVIPEFGSPGVAVGAAAVAAAGAYAWHRHHQHDHDHDHDHDHEAAPA